MIPFVVPPSGGTRPEAAPPHSRPAKTTGLGTLGRFLPLLFTYFYDFLTVTQAAVTGIEPTAMGHLFLSRASL